MGERQTTTKISNHLLSFALGAASQRKFAQFFLGTELDCFERERERERERKASHDQPWRTEVGVFILHTKKIELVVGWGKGRKWEGGLVGGRG